MSNLTIGDMATTFQLRKLTNTSRTALTRLSQELTSGVKSDLGAAVAGDFGPIAGIERNLRANNAYRTVNAEAGSMLTAAQLALGSVQDLASNLSPALLTAASARDVTLIDATSEDAKQKFSSVVARFNTRIADRSFFSGAATDRNALADGDTMLADLAAVTASLTTAADVEAAVTAWFDDSGGGFETTGYTGSLADMGPMIIADGEEIALDVRADDQTVRDMLKGFAMAALIAEGTLAGDVAAQADLIEISAGRLVAAENDVTTLRARIGTLEERVEDAQARNAAERSAYELARNEIVEADPYETATMLQTVIAQIESLYTITARISRLRFTDYMR